tara:strand:- start:8933 stop:10270 length:1338 start_codon:yes stop_codon:yes gene_type:complete
MSNKKYSVTISKKINKFNKTIRVDSDKSISIRSFLIGSISNDISRIRNVLESDDVLSAVNCLRKLGIKIQKQKNKDYYVYGKGIGSLSIKRNGTLNCGNSGTLARLLIGILSTTPNIQVIVKGDKSLNKRNMKKLIDLANSFGAEFYPKNKFNLPLKIISSEMPIGINYTAGISAQLKSACILAGLNSYGVTNIFEKKNKSRNHTENILLNSPEVIRVKKDSIKLFGKKSLKPLNLSIPGDPSSAAFFCALALLTKDSYLKIKNVGLNPRRIGFYKLLKKSGAKINFKNIRKKNNEIIGDIHVESSKIKPIKSNSKIYPSTADEYLILFVISALTPGKHIFNGIADLANKESSRAYEMKKILNKLGVKCKLMKDKMTILGTKNIKNKRIKIPNLKDHRICMSVVILSLCSSCNVNIQGFETVETSSPSFLKLIKYIGGKFSVKKN